MSFQKVRLLWVGFAVLLVLSVVNLGLLLWLVLGPWGPPAPWRATPVVQTNATPTARPDAIPSRPSLQPNLSPLPTEEARPTLLPLPPGTGSETAQRLAEAIIPPRDLVEIAGRLYYDGTPPPRTAPPDDRPYTVGRKDRFWITDPALDRQREITAVLRLITPHLYMYVEEGADYDHDSLEEAARVFEEEIYPTNRDALGSEWSPGVDGDPHLVILHAYFEGAAGYFSSQDEVPVQVNASSNQHEMFYMNLDAFGDIGEPFYLSTLAHEFQHMIHWYQDPRSDAWVDEGMAQMAEDLNGYDADDIAWAFLFTPDLQLTTWTDEEDETLAHYAASYLWFRYFTDRMGTLEVLRQVLDPTVSDIPAIEAILEEKGYRPVIPGLRPFDAFFADWAVTNYLNDPSFADGRYAYSVDLDGDTAWADNWAFILPWETSETVFPYATDYIEVEALEHGTLQVIFDGQEAIPLLDTSPYSGEHFWWSNRADLSDTHLTRAFDLRGVDQATLRCRLWYDIEDDYDYAYIMVSTDGGRTWDLLEGPSMTDTNPNGNNLGYGYTGASGGSDPPVWIEEEVDLSPYAGQEILLRFEMVTDDALNTSGLAVDDIEIPAIGFFDDAEQEEGWEAAGFVWVDNWVPVNYAVQIITLDDNDRPLSLQYIPLDESRHGELEVAGYGSDLVKAVLVISAFAPATTEPAPYELRLSIR